MAEAGSLANEDRIMRVWTPWILRSVLITASILLLVGLGLSTRTPARFVGRFRSVQAGKTLHARENWASMTAGVVYGDPHDIVTLGLVVLTLVPIVRVAFTFVLFVKERDEVFIAATAYVLIGLVAGILLGSIG